MSSWGRSYQKSDFFMLFISSIFISPLSVLHKHLSASGVKSRIVLQKMIKNCVHVLTDGLLSVIVVNRIEAQLRSVTFFRRLAKPPGLVEKVKGEAAEAGHSGGAFAD
ncbi:MAG: hypothetical protein IJH80_08860 [Ruminococcus sp.]|nr:hypothetical protein [Ruminococcus sp.]